MRGNPVGNQIRFLQTQLDAEKKNNTMLMTALETKAPDVFTEYQRLKDADAAANAPPPVVQQQQSNRFQQQNQFQPSQPVTRTPGGRF
jgi:hypothetical protein